jgi:hypothetical protein
MGGDTYPRVRLWIEKELKAYPVDRPTRITSPGRYLIAGLGPLMPIAANLLVVDFENILIQFSLPVVVGYMAAL